MASIRKRPLQILAIVILFIAAALWLFLSVKSKGYFSGLVRETGSEFSDYSTVQVAGGGVYFGKIISLTPDSLVLENVFSYGNVASNSAQSQSSDASTRPTIFDTSKVGVATGGKYTISRSQVLIYYSLKNDSEVVKTILSYLANPSAVPTVTPAK